MSAFPESGRSIDQKYVIPKGRFRPKAVIPIKLKKTPPKRGSRDNLATNCQSSSVQVKDDVGVEETVGIEGVKAENENAGAACTSESARAARDLERGLDCEVKIVVGEVVQARRGMAAYRFKHVHNTDRAAFDDAGDGGTVFSRDRESCGDHVSTNIETVKADSGCRKWEFAAWY